MAEKTNNIFYLRKQYTVHKKAIQREKSKEILDEDKIKWHINCCEALAWAISRLDPTVRSGKRIPATARHLHNTKTYSITMSPEDHDRLATLGKELHINGGFSGVLTYIAQNCVLIHE